MNHQIHPVTAVWHRVGSDDLGIEIIYSVYLPDLFLPAQSYADNFLLLSLTFPYVLQLIYNYNISLFLLLWRHGSSGEVVSTLGL